MLFSGDLLTLRSLGVVGLELWEGFMYLVSQEASVFHALGMLVLRTEGSQVSEAGRRCAA